MAVSNGKAGRYSSQQQCDFRTQEKRRQSAASQMPESTRGALHTTRNAALAQAVKDRRIGGRLSFPFETKSMARYNLRQYKLCAFYPCRQIALSACIIRRIQPQILYPLRWQFRRKKDLRKNQVDHHTGTKTENNETNANQIRQFFAAPIH